jgi:hypothetical protein
MMQFFAVISGLLGTGGSIDSTSSPAPAIQAGIQRIGYIGFIEQASATGVK